jgi:lipid II:glycine glycyltransferase (peptidoglycan interpeptide bridge formation enzyme)
MLEAFAASGAHNLHVRFHPLLGNHALAPASVPLRPPRTTIAVDLRSSVEDIWTMKFDNNNREMIRRAERHRLQFEVDDRFERLAEFHRIYRVTMELEIELSRLNCEEGRRQKG